MAAQALSSFGTIIDVHIMLFGAKLYRHGRDVTSSLYIIFIPLYVLVLDCRPIALHALN
jgi:hypothetical protein